jgi:hypothetical protein
MAKKTTSKTAGDNEPRAESGGSCACPFERLFSEMFGDPHLREARDKVRSSSADLLRAFRAVIDWGIERMESESPRDEKLHRVTVD